MNDLAAKDAGAQVGRGDVCPNAPLPEVRPAGTATLDRVPPGPENQSILTFSSEQLKLEVPFSILSILANIMECIPGLFSRVPSIVD